VARGVQHDLLAPRLFGAVRIAGYGPRVLICTRMVVRCALVFLVMTVSSRCRSCLVLAFALSVGLSFRALLLILMVRLWLGLRRVMRRWLCASASDLILAPVRVMPVGVSLLWARWGMRLMPVGSSIVRAVSLGACLATATVKRSAA
jgi:hypothetical protein